MRMEAIDKLRNELVYLADGVLLPYFGGGTPTIDLTTLLRLCLEKVQQHDGAPSARTGADATRDTTPNEARKAIHLSLTFADTHAPVREVDATRALLKAVSPQRLSPSPAEPDASQDLALPACNSTSPCASSYSPTQPTQAATPLLTYVPTPTSQHQHPTAVSPPQPVTRQSSSCMPHLKHSAAPRPTSQSTRQASHPAIVCNAAAAARLAAEAASAAAELAATDRAQGPIASTMSGTHAAETRVCWYL